jgi:hypothetical protein
VQAGGFTPPGPGRPGPPPVEYFGKEEAGAPR